MRTALYLSALALILGAKTVYGYTSMIGYGFKSCLNCHYNAFGGGPLTDFGRSTSAVTLDSMRFQPGGINDEQVASTSGFLGTTRLPNWLRPYVKYRGVQTSTDINRTKTESTYTTTQLDAGLTLQFGSDNQWLISGSVGYGKKPRTPLEKEDEEKYNDFTSREYYLSYAPFSAFRIYAGLMDKVYGIRTVDYDSFAKSQNDLGQNDQVHGVFLHFYHDLFEIGASGFFDDLRKEDLNRRKGASLRFETGTDDIRIGLSAMGALSEYKVMDQQSLHLRMSFGEGSSILAEGGVVRDRNKPGDFKSQGIYGYLRGQIKLFRGLHFLNTLDFVRQDIKQDSPLTFRLGPGLQFFPTNRLELRADLINTKSFSDKSVDRDTWDLRAQVHVWL